jgi:hypothetical protein
MDTIKLQLAKITTPNNLKLVYILISLIALAVAAGAPGAESGIGGR